MAGERTPELTTAAHLATDVGGPWLDILFAVVLLGLVVARRGHAAALLLLGAGGAILVNNAIKQIIERPRPHGGIVAVSSSSWPSGHAATSIAFYGALAVIAVRGARLAAGARAAVWVALALLTGLIGASRVYLGVHYPSDVAAGWTVGGLWLLGVVRLMRPGPSAVAGAEKAEPGDVD